MTEEKYTTATIREGGEALTIQGDGLFMEIEAKVPLSAWKEIETAFKDFVDKLSEESTW